MDDIYFSKKKKNSEPPDGSENSFNLPPLNQPDGGTGEPRLPDDTEPFEETDIFSYSNDENEGSNDSGGKGGYQIPHFTPTQRPQPPEITAPAQRPGPTENNDPDLDSGTVILTPTGTLKPTDPRYRPAEPARDIYAPYMGRSRRIKKEKKPKPSDAVEQGAYEETLPSPPKKKKKFKLKLIALLLIIALIAPFASVFALISGSDYTRDKLKKNSFISSSELASDKKVTNILLIGVDGQSDEENLRSDSMILLSIDSEHKKIKLSSFMRDSWVEIPDYKFAKLNAACSHGGPQLVCDTIEYNFKVDIEDYVLVSFDMFAKIINAVGGIEVDITEKEAKFINRTTRCTVESGENVHLNGYEALVYARIRKLDSDYMRTFRQRKIMKALIVKAKKAGPVKLYKIVNDVLPMVKTSLSSMELTSLAFKGAASLIAFDTVSTRIPTDELSWDSYKGSQSVVELDIPANAEFLYDFIYKDSTDTEGVDEN